MKFDIFLSICQTPVEGKTPSERQMFQNFFDQVRLADELGYGTAWVAETHLSTQVQKRTSHAVVPEFQGEIGLNTDILQLAQVIFAKTKNINVGSAIRNILCNGGPIAHAEAIRTFLSIHGLDEGEKRRLNIGFASGRFEFSNRPYGIRPRNLMEQAAWPVVKGKALREATEIFLRLLKGEKLASKDVPYQYLRPSDFRNEEEWKKTLEAHKGDRTMAEMAHIEEIRVDKFWEFEVVGVIPTEAPMHLLDLTIGTHDPETQILANRFLPVSVFNLSITPSNVVEETHERMRQHYNPAGGEWHRSYMPRTALVFLDNTPGASEEEKNRRAQERAQKAWKNYWKAMEGTLDKEKVAKAVNNALAGSPSVLAEQIKEKYHPDDRLMLWFDFNNHNNDEVKQSMRDFMENVAPQLGE